MSHPGTCSAPRDTSHSRHFRFSFGMRSGTDLSTMSRLSVPHAFSDGFRFRFHRLNKCRGDIGREVFAAAGPSTGCRSPGGWAPRLRIGRFATWNDVTGVTAAASHQQNPPKSGRIMLSPSHVQLVYRAPPSVSLNPDREGRHLIRRRPTHPQQPPMDVSPPQVTL